ncbi:MAG: DNA alkylation repair protein [Candidatus Micrarchaeota archaeon]
MNCTEIVKIIKQNANKANMEGMIRFGISAKNTYGVNIPVLRKMAKQIGKNHTLAQQLWVTEIHEARILAGLIDEPAAVTEAQMDRWAADFDSWDVCDQVCSNLFDKTPFAFSKVVEYGRSEKEFVKRTAFALTAALAVHDKEADDAAFIRLLPLLKKASTDERNFVRKAVNWALRQIGKRNIALNAKALATARAIQKIDSKAARWIAADAIRELESSAVKNRLKLKNTKK